MTHTSGPWSNVAKEHLDDPSCPEFLIRCGTGYVATVDSSRDENTDNARLIAAAPDLLEAVQNLMGLFDTPVARRRLKDDALYSEVINQARAAIARAKGE